MTSDSAKPMYEQIAETYRNRILEGDLREGTMLPAQGTLAQELGVSEVTVRKALQVLVHENLIYRIRKKGTFVKDKAEYVPANTNTKVQRIYFVYNDVRASILTQEIHQLTLNGIADACAARDIDFAIYNVNGGSSLPSSEMPTGYILWGFEWKSMDLIEHWSQQGARMVTLHNYFPHLDIPYVNCDNHTGGYLATQHLLSLGHRRIGTIMYGRSNVEMYRDWGQRLQGFNLALSNNGVQTDPNLVVVGDGDLESVGYEGMKRLLSLESPPTAIFAAADFIALGAIKAALALGKSVPHDISIIGYDGYSFGNYTEPPLTTVNQNFYSLGKMGVQKLLSNPAQGLESLVSPELILRSSTQRIYGQTPTIGHGTTHAKQD